MFALTLVSLLSGCAYAVKPTKPIPLDPRVFDSMAIQTEIRAIHFSPRPGIWLRSVYKYEWLSVEDPLPSVKERFVDALKTRKSNQNIRTISQPRLNNSLPQLKRTFKRGLVLSFHTTDWGLDPYRDDKMYYHIQYSVVARLIRVESEEILWQSECRVTENDAPGKRATYHDFLLDDFSLLKIKRKEVTEKCAEELFNNFMGI